MPATPPRTGRTITALVLLTLVLLCVAGGVRYARTGAVPWSTVTIALVMAGATTSARRREAERANRAPGSR